MSAVFALLASVVYGIADFIAGFVGRRVSTWIVVFWSQVVGLLLGLGASLIFPADGLSTADLLWGVVSGLAGMIGIFALYEGLARGRMAVVSPLAALLSALIPVGIGVAIGERPLTHEWMGVALAFPAIWAVAAGTDAKGKQGGVGMGLLAGVGFGLFFAAIAQAGDGAGFWPLVAARATSGALFGVVVWRRREPLPPAGSRFLIVIVGVGDALANVFLLVAYRSGLMSLVSVLASLYPALTVCLAVLVLKEPLRRRQLLGLGLALAAVVLIAL